MALINEAKNLEGKLSLKFSFRKLERGRELHTVCLGDSLSEPRSRGTITWKPLTLLNVVNSLLRANMTINEPSSIMVFQISRDHLGKPMNKLTFLNLPIRGFSESEIDALIKGLVQPDRTKSKVLNFIGNDRYSDKIDVLCHFMKESLLSNGELWRQATLFGLKV